ncbi:MAG TPA: choice-of-anchor Q domain-containing protein [Edaphocola sp.]|nr:choice-of-anchor Q domain-containing protein [Edaphocola sp.]
MKNLKLNFQFALLVTAAFVCFNKTLIAQITPNANGVVFVNKSVVGGNQSGSSWANAALEVADALLSAHSNSSIQEIWVAKGTYTPKYSAGTDNMSPAIQFGSPNCSYFGSLVIVNNVKLYGGFQNANETSITQRDTINNNTILDGLDSFVHVVMSVGNVGSAELNGFSIKNGKSFPYQTLYVNGQPTRSANGGGVLLQNTHLRIFNCNIMNNTANLGGGIYAENSSLTMKRTKLTNNNAIRTDGSNNQGFSATSGGGVYFLNGIALTIDSCDFSNNTAISTRLEALGGGLGISQNTPAQINISYSTFQGNGAYLNLPSGATPPYVNVFGGGLCIFNINQVATITNCEFSNNTAQISAANATLSNTTSNNLSGAGIFNASPLLINNSIIKDNTLTANVDLSNNPIGSTAGAGIATDGSMAINGNNVGGVNTGVNLTINNTLIENNEATGNLNPIGGGIAYIMNMYLLPTAVIPKINNSIIRNNVAQQGGGIYCFTLAPIIKNTLLYGNSATNGSVIYNKSQGQSAHPQLINCTVYGHNAKSSSNTAPLFSNNNSSTTTLHNSIVYNNSGVFSSTSNIVSYSIIEGSSLFPGVGNKNQDPQFVNPSAGDFGLLVTSPAANKGNNSLYASVGNLSNDTDLVGNPRLYENTIDMGAFELQSRAVDTSTSIFTFNNNNNIKVYPIPVLAGGKMNIDFNYSFANINGAQLIVTDFAGRILQTREVNELKIQLQTPKLPGTYFVSIILLSGEKSTRSISVF